MTPKQETAMQQALEALIANRRKHYYCEDTWYSCPRHEEGCANDAAGDECNCGADQANLEIDKVTIALQEALAEQEPVQEPDLNHCPQCGGPADNGFSRSIPPSPFFCTKCMEKLEKNT